MLSVLQPFPAKPQSSHLRLIILKASCTFPAQKEDSLIFEDLLSLRKRQTHLGERQILQGIHLFNSRRWGGCPRQVLDVHCLTYPSFVLSFLLPPPVSSLAVH